MKHLEDVAKMSLKAKYVSKNVRSDGVVYECQREDMAGSFIASICRFVDLYTKFLLSCCHRHF